MLISLEYSHIYVDENFNGEHRQSVEIAKYLSSSDSLNTYHKVILVDDYSPIENILSINDLSDRLDSIQMKPDTICYEGDLVLSAKALLKDVKSDRIRREYERYIEKREGRIPCSLFIAAWHLVRLGEYRNERIDLPVADKLISVLPDRFKLFEDRAQEIIASTDYSNLLDKIERNYFESEYDRKYKYQL